VCLVSVGRRAGSEIQRGSSADTGYIGGGGHRHGGAVLVERSGDPITPPQPDVETRQPVAGELAAIANQPCHDEAPRKIAPIPSPPPIHMVSSARPPPRRRSSYSIGA